MRSRPIVRTACIGCGVIGASWATAFARAGHDVRLFDVAASAATRAAAAIDAQADFLAPAGGVAFGRVEVARSIAEAVLDADYVQESVSEDLDVKRRLFEHLDEAAPDDAILASSTSEIQPSLFLQDLRGRGRALVVHPINPPHLIPLVEVCGAPWTSPETIDRTVGFLKDIGSEPVVLRRELPGFILNRLQMALIREALNLVDSGVCSARDVDRVVRLGLGRRWALLGPFEGGHLNANAGYRDYMIKFGSSIGHLMSTLGTQNEIRADLVQMIDAELRIEVPGDQIEARQKLRDLRLASLASHLDAAAREAVAG